MNTQPIPFRVLVTNKGYILDVNLFDEFLYTDDRKAGHVFNPKLRAEWEKKEGVKLVDLDMSEII